MAVTLTICASDIFSSVNTHRPSSNASRQDFLFRSMDGHFTQGVSVFGRIVNVDVEFPATAVLRPAVIRTNGRAEFMTRFLDLSIHDLAIMVGLGCFAGSASSVLWDIFAASPAPKEFAIPAALIGFVLGKIVSDRAGARAHA